jgi:hypothetical protein
MSIKLYKKGELLTTIYSDSFYNLLFIYSIYSHYDKFYLVEDLIKSQDKEVRNLGYRLLTKCSCGTELYLSYNTVTNKDFDFVKFVIE